MDDTDLRRASVASDDDFHDNRALNSVDERRARVSGFDFFDQARCGYRPARAVNARVEMKHDERSGKADTDGAWSEASAHSPQSKAAWLNSRGTGIVRVLAITIRWAIFPDTWKKSLHPISATPRVGGVYLIGLWPDGC